MSVERNIFHQHTSPPLCHNITSAKSMHYPKILRCILAEGRHSFELGGGCTGTTDVKFYTGDGCPGAAYIDYQYFGPGCYTVNTGAHWGSSLVSVS